VGTNPLTSGHHIWKFIQDSGAHTVAIDPMHSRTAEQRIDGECDHRRT
jgi:hypothetical protein